MATAVLKTDLFYFFEQLPSARSRLLFVDYDGTIAPFSVVRNQAFPYVQVPELIDSIVSTCDTRVVLITGRPAREIPQLLGDIPQLEIWGSHGLERVRGDNTYESLAIEEEAAAALAEAKLRLAAEGLGSFCEHKRGAVAVHWRGLGPAQVGELRTAAYRSLAGLACSAGLRLSEFDGGVELHVRACNKAHAVRTVLSEMPDDVTVAYLGDDIADEDAFSEVNQRGLTVLVRPTPRATKAKAWIKPPEEVVQFLLDWIQACGGDV